MKKTNKPRSLVLTGISEECRKIAKKAAKEQQLTLAEWFENLIYTHAYDPQVNIQQIVESTLRQRTQDLADRVSNNPELIKKLKHKMKSPWYIRLSDKIFGK